MDTMTISLARIIIVSCVFAFSIMQSATAQTSQKISVMEAETLICEALKPQHASGVGLDYYEPGQTDPGFYIFDALNPGSDPNVSANFGTFAVNVATGDVWDVAGQCKRLTSPALEKLQRGFRDRLKL